VVAQLPSVGKSMVRLKQRKADSGGGAGGRKGAGVRGRQGNLMHDGKRVRVRLM